MIGWSKCLNRRFKYLHIFLLWTMNNMSGTTWYSPNLTSSLLLITLWCSPYKVSNPEQINLRTWMLMLISTSNKNVTCTLRNHHFRWFECMEHAPYHRRVRWFAPIKKVRSNRHGSISKFHKIASCDDERWGVGTFHASSTSSEIWFSKLFLRHAHISPANGLSQQSNMRKKVEGELARWNTGVGSSLLGSPSSSGFKVCRQRARKEDVYLEFWNHPSMRNVQKRHGNHRWRIQT